MNWPCCKSLLLSYFLTPIGIWCPVYLNNTGLFSGRIFHLMHLKGSGLSMGHGLGWEHDLTIWMYWKSWNAGGMFEEKCTITINWTISFCHKFPLKPFVVGNALSRVEPRVPQLRLFITGVTNCFLVQGYRSPSSYPSLALTYIYTYIWTADHNWMFFLEYYFPNP